MKTASEKLREIAKQYGYEFSGTEEEKKQPTASDRLRQIAGAYGYDFTEKDSTLTVQKRREDSASSSLSPGETRRSVQSSSRGETNRDKGKRWLTGRPEEDIRAEISRLDEEIYGLRGKASVTNVPYYRPTKSAQEKDEQNKTRLSFLETSRDELRGELLNRKTSLKEASDFEEKSQPNAAYATTDEAYRLVNYPDGYEGYKKMVSEKNDPETVRSLFASATRVKSMVDSIKENQQYLRNMTADERQTYNYLYETEGKESADEYLGLIENELLARRRKQTDTEAEIFASEHPVLSSVYTVASKPASAAASVQGILGDYLKFKDLYVNAPYNEGVNTSSKIRETVSDDIKRTWGPAGSFAYDVGMSMADFLAPGMISTESSFNIASAVLTSSVAAESTLSALDRGVDDTSALAFGAITGAAEYFLGRGVFDSLFKSPYWGKNSWRYILKNAGSEALEEGGTSVADVLGDVIFSRDKSEWQQSINAYVEQGFSKKSAVLNTLKDTAIMVGLDAIGGALGGAAAAGGGVAIAKTGQAAVNRENIRAAQETWRGARKVSDYNRAADTADYIDKNGFAEADAGEPVIVSRPTATTEGEEFEIGREVLRDQLMTIEQQERADMIDNADDLTATALKYDATPNQISQARALSDLTGYSVEFFRQKNPNGTVKNGFYDPDSNKIYLNVNSKRTIATTFGHELTHTLEGTSAYESLRDHVFGILRSSGKDIDTERQKTADIYKKAGKDFRDTDQLDADIVAEYAGKVLFNDADAIREVYRDSPSAARKIASAIDRMLIRATGMQDTTAKAFLERASAMYQRADEATENSEKEINRRLDEQEAVQATGGESVPQTGSPVQPAEAAAAPGSSGTAIPVSEEQRKPSETVGQRQTAPQTGGTVSGGAETRATETEVQEGVRTSMDESDAADRMLEDLNRRYENGEISDEEYDEAYELIEEARLTGRGIESSADVVDNVEGKIPRGIRKLGEKLGIRPKGEQYSISEDDVRERVATGRPVEAADENMRDIAGDIAEKIRADEGDVKWSVSAEEKAQPTENGMLVDRYAGMEGQNNVFRNLLMRQNQRMVDAIVAHRGQTKTEKFREWFGKSTVINNDGEPMVVFRGTTMTDSVLDHNDKPIWFSNNMGYAVQYSNHVGWTDMFRRSSKIFGGAEKKIIPAYIRAVNPADFGNTDGNFEDILPVISRKLGISEEELRNVWLKTGMQELAWETVHTAEMKNLLSSYGYDSIKAIEFGTDTWGVFDSRQVKSAVANNGKFNPNRSDIRYSVSEDDDQTRTPFFKRWFGDWENDPANASKVVNADGTPKVMYHGTSRGGFNMFNTYGSNYGLFGVGSYFTDNRDVAEGYTHKGRGDSPKIYSVYLNIRNPLDMDAPADMDLWLGQAEYAVDGGILLDLSAPEGTVIEPNDLVKALQKCRTGEECYRALEQYCADEEMYKEDAQEFIIDFITDMGYDGITHIGGGRFNKADTTRHRVYIAFDPTQIKSATDNIGTFDPDNSDIRYSVSEDEPTTPYSALPVKAQTRVRELESAFGRAMDKMFGLGMTYKSPDFRQFLADNVRPLVNTYLENGSIPQEESDALFRSFYNPLSGTDEDLQKQEFYSAFEQMEEGLREVARYAASGKQQADSAAEEPSPLPTTEEAEELFRAQRDARREMDKVMYKLMLRPEDEVKVGELLRGTTSADQIDPETHNKQSILEAYRVQKAFRDADAAVSVYKKRLKAELYRHVDAYLGNIAQWKDKAVPLLYQRETMERNIRDIIPDKAEADAFIAEFIIPVHHAEAERQRFLAEYRDRIRNLGLSSKVQKGNAQSEAYAVQLLGEAQDNIRILSLSGRRDQKRDGHTLAEWQLLIDNFWNENPNMDRAKIERAIGEFRQIYNELLPKINEVRIRNGYAPVAFRQGYFPHFTATSEDTVLAKLLRPFGIQFNADALPTAINGLTADFKPGITYFQFGNERLGFETTYDALQGYEMYLNAASDVIYHTDNIQKLRALATRIRYLTGDEGVKQQIDKVRNNDTLDEAEKQVQLEEIYRKGRYRMSNFVVAADEYTNALANKKSRFDRGVEELFGRPAYSVMKALESRVASNMIAGNLGSALTNIIPLNQANAILGNVNVLKGMYQTVRGMAKDDGFAAASDFLTNRRGSDSLVRTTSQKVSDMASIPMNFIDSIVSESIVRAAYMKNLAGGMGEDLALQHADALAASIMADRSKGALPLLFNARNPLMKLFTQFQVEVNNEYSVIFKDIPELAKADAKTRAGAAARIAGMLFKYLVGAWLFNDLYEKLFGRRAALDLVEMLNNAVGGISGYQVPNVVNLAGEAITGDLTAEDFAVEAQDPGKVLQTLGTEAAESLPFIGGVLGGGRVPIQSALPDLSNLTMAATSDTWTGKKKALTAFEELSKPAAYLLPPFGGGQIQKMLRGVAAALQGGVYGVEGDEDGGTYLKYPVYNDWQDQLNAIVFGTTYTEGGREWVDSGFKSLSVKQTTAYQAMKEFGADDRAAYDLIQAYKSVPDGEGRSAAQRDVIRSAGIPGGAKYAAYYNLGASDARRALIDAIADTEPEANLGEAAEVLMDISDIRTGKTAGVCDLLAQSGLTEETKKLIYRQEVSDQRGDDIAAAEWAGITFDEYLDAHGAYSAIGNKDLSKAEQALEFARYVEGMSLSDSQKDTVREIFKFYSQIPVQAKNYNELRDIGISDDYAAKLVRAVDALEPLPGEKSVSSIQKARVVVDTISDADDRLAALGTVLSDSQFRKVSVAADAGLDPEVWVAFREILPEFDSDANGSYTQGEMEDAIRAFSNGSNYGTMLMKAARNLSRDEMAILWQIGGSWKSTNNPFSKTTGKYVKDLLDAEKKG